MLTVHHLEHSRSQRILWLLEELGADYELKRHARDPETSLAPAALRDIHPLGKAPLITDGATTVAESGAIIEYLTGKFDDRTLVPAEQTAERLRYVYWLHYAEGTFMPLMIISLILNRIETAKLPFFARPVARGIVAKVRRNYLDDNVRRNLEFMEATLSAGDWFCGSQFSAADIQMSFAVEAAEVRTDLTSEYPSLGEFLERIRARPAYRRALEKGGPYLLKGVNQGK